MAFIMIFNSATTKRFSIVLSIVFVTFLYAIIQKKSVDSYFLSSKEQVLQEVPAFSAVSLNGVTVNSQALISKGEQNGLLVHFWATWCAPCEAELPSFIRLAKKFENKKIKFIIIAANDEEVKIKKFLKKIGTLPANVLTINDQSSEVMSRFGTVKVPETYLFNRNGKLLKKFVGQQEWMIDHYSERIEKLLDSQI